MINNYKKMKGLRSSLMSILVTALCLLTFNSVKAQISTMAFSSANPGSYAARMITGGQLVSTSSASTDDDNTYAAQNIGFNFVWQGNTFTSVGISANGYLKLGGVTANIYSNAPTSQANTISAMNADLQGAGLSTSNIRIDTVGTAPYRTCVIQFRDWSSYYYNTSILYNFQIRLNETINSVEFVYGPCSNSSYTVYTGLSGATTADYAVLSNSTSSWAAPVASSTVTSGSMTFGSTSIPDSGRTYKWENLPMTFNSVTTTQTIGNSATGTNNNPILAAVANTTGNLNPKVVYGIDFTTAGSNNLSNNVSAARVLYTGNNPTFSLGAVIRQFGSSITSPSGTLNFTSAGDTLRAGNNYYWLVYDLTTTATNGDTLDGTCIGFTDSMFRVPTITSPAGYKIVAGAMSGVYTIGGPSGARNYASFATAIADLIAVGLAGPVTFNVAAGTYPQVTIPNNVITNASAINTITFDGINPSSRAIEANVTSQAALLLNGCKYYTFKNFTVRNTSSNGCSGVGIVGTTTTNAGSSNTIKGCTILLPNVGTNTSFGICVSSSANGYGSGATAIDSITLDSNTVTGGGTNGVYYGYQIYGAQNTSYNRGMVVTNNTLTLGYYMGFYMPYIYNAGKYNYNTVNMNPTYGYYAMYNYYHQNSSTTQSIEYIGNVVRNFGGYGMYLYHNGSAGTSTAPLKIYNNVVDNGTSSYGGYYGIYLYNTGYTEYYHNTTRMTYNAGNAQYTGLYYTGGVNILAKNNVFAIGPNAGPASPAYFATSPSTSFVNYNLYYNAANTTLLYRGSVFTSSNFKTTTAGGDSSSFTTASPFASNTDLRLANGCFGKGVDLTSIVPLDLTRYTRNVPPDYGAYEFTGGAAGDLSVYQLVTPVAPIVTGAQDVIFRVRNLGTTTVTSFDASYTLNGGTAVSQVWTGSLASCGTDSVLFSGSNQITLGSSNAVKVYTANPNFGTDPNRANDTISVLLTGPLNGAYTINPSAAVSTTNFQSFATAIAALSGGVAGPVTFTVSPGTYPQVTLTGVYSGASATNLVTFVGANRATTIISTSTGSQAALMLNATRYVTFKDFTVTNTFSGSASGAGICNGNMNTFKNLLILLPNVSTSTAYGVCVSGSSVGFGTSATTADSVTLDSNTVTGGGSNGVYYGYLIYGNQNAANNRGIVVTGNTLTLGYYMGFYMPYIYNAGKYNYNTVNMNPTYGYYGMYNYYHQNSSTTQSIEYIGNRVYNFGGYGIYMYMNGSGGTATAPLKVFNNIIDNGTSSYAGYYGIYLYNTGYTDFYNNNIRMTYPTTSTTYCCLYSTGSALGIFKNNVFVRESTGGTGTTAYFATSPATGNVNYNVYYNMANTNVLYRGGFLTSLTYKTTTGGGDSSSYVTTLPFVNAAIGNYNLKNGCGLKGIANPNNLIDYTGYTRNSPPDVGAYEFQGGFSNEVALDALLSPVFPIAAGTNVVAARIRNTGANTVTSFDLSYSVNGGTAVTTSWFGTLNSCDTVSVSLSTPFTVVAGTIYNLKVYTSNPNFSTDPNRANDTVSSQVVTPMNGTYTIGATASDFTSFNAAVAGLTSRGVAGPVTFNVRTGTYVETIDYTSAPGVSGVNTVTFQSMANNKDSVIIVPATSAAQIWKFNNSSYTTLSKLTLRSTSTVSTQNGIVITGASSFDTIIGCNIDMAVQTSYGNYSVYGTGLTSSCNGVTIKNGIINGSYYGIYMYGTTNTLASRYWNFTVDNNIIGNSYVYGFYSYYSQGLNYINNTVNTSSGYSGQIYYYMYADSFNFSGNKINLLNAVTMYIGYYSSNGNGITGRRGKVANNSFFGGAGSSTIYLGYQSNNIDYINNTFNINSATQAAYIYNSGSVNLVFKNNIFANTGTGSAAYFAAIPTPTTALMNNNNYFTYGSSLTGGVGASTTLPLWRTACSCDKLSINYRPAVTSLSNNTPNPADTAVWALNGRGDFFAINPTDINGVLRPASIVDGAPDLGAYNVNPGASTLAPTATATPAAPTAGTTQVFTLGNDTVASISWDAFTTPPASVAVRQYSGKAPIQIGSSIPNFPYFYTSITAPAGTYLYDAKINYRDNWMGTMYTTFGFTEDYMRLANKEVGVAWNTNSGGLVDTTNNNLTYTGFSNATQLFTGSDIFNPLPVKLTTFNGSLLNADAKLTWTTASEINANMFVVERSIDGKNFIAITNVKAAGNTSSLTSYNHLDKGIITLLNSAGTIYYRLKMVDNDNSFSYSKTIEIKTVENTKEKVTVTPNPFTTDLTITVETVNNANGTVEVSDINGRTIISQNIDVVKGTSTITVNGVDKLKQGIYFVRYTTESNTQVFKMLKN